MTPDFFTRNRQRLADELDTRHPIVLTAHIALQRAGDSAYSFVQEPNFYYLTGIQEPGWQMILHGKKAWLVQPRRSKVQRIFEGALTRSEAARISGIETVISPTQATKLLHEMARTHTDVVSLGVDPYARHYAFASNPAPARLRQRLRKLFTKLEDCRPVLQKLRAVKTPEEITALRQSITVTCDAFEAVKTADRTYANEYILQAEFDYAFTRMRASHAYDPIVAGDGRACTLHYIANNQPIDTSVLLDIGAQLSHRYTADISRSWWLGKGAPHERYKQVHRAVVGAQRDIIGLIRPGMKLQEYAKKAEQRVGQVIGELGLGNVDDVKARRRYMPHAVSHAMGLEVHEGFGGYKTFTPGMVLTVEPGIYLPDEGFGVRIEDDILVTENGYENLSANLSTDW